MDSAVVGAVGLSISECVGGRESGGGAGVDA